MESVRSFLKLPKDAPTGKGVVVGLIDTGVDYEHPDLKDVIDREISLDCRVEGAKPGAGDFSDGCGHGTRVAGIIAGSGAASGGKYRGIAPDARIVALKLSENVHPETWVTAIALNTAVELRLPIVNFSFGSNPRAPGSPTEYIDPPWVWSSTGKVSASLHEAAVRGMLCIVPAGNNGSEGEGTLGRNCGMEEVLAVGACDCDGNHCEFSSIGPYYRDTEPSKGVRTHLGLLEANAHIPAAKPDFVVPGARMMVPRASSSPAAKGAQGDPATFGGRYKADFGTSLAAAVTTGLAACALELLRDGPRDLGADVGRVLRKIFREAAAVESKTDTNRYGMGILRWPAIDTMIRRFNEDTEFYLYILAP